MIITIIKIEYQIDGSFISFFKSIIPFSSI